MRRDWIGQGCIISLVVWCALTWLNDRHDAPSADSRSTAPSLIGAASSKASCKQAGPPPHAGRQAPSNGPSCSRL